MRKFIFLMILAIAVSSCVSEKGTTGWNSSVKAGNKQKTDKKLTDAERKALTDADLWLPTDTSKK